MIRASNEFKLENLKSKRLSVKTELKNLNKNSKLVFTACHGEEKEKTQRPGVTSP